MAKKKINAKEVVKDIESGMASNALMGKYDLSPGQLESLMKKLEAAGLLQRQEPPEQPPPPAEAPIAYSFFSCPSCGLDADEEFDECPRCGVVVSKYEPPKNPPASEQTIPGAGGKPVIEVWPEKTRRNLRGIKIIAVLALILAALVTFVLFDKHRQAEQSAARPDPVQETMSEEEMSEQDRLDSLSDGKPPRYRRMIDKKLPHVEPINPELDTYMKKSLGDLGERLDERSRLREDLTNQP
ncbi:MAG: hypothetical protein RDU20_19210 [Desulfomonilaceae bacterium]|nr:hypothetical protein [Desulfomonilaceae bacterium]